MSDYKPNNTQWLGSKHTRLVCCSVSLSMKLDSDDLELSVEWIFRQTNIKFLV